MKVLKYIGIVILVLLLIFFGKGLMTPSVAYECEITVDKSAKEVWAVMSDESTAAEWVTGYKRSELISGTPNTVGAVSHIFVEEQGQETMMEETIVTAEPYDRYGMQFTMDFMNMDYEMVLEEKDGKTLVRSKSSTQGNGLFAKSIISFMPGMMKKQEEENLMKLKNVIESNTKNYFPEKMQEESTAEEDN